MGNYAAINLRPMAEDGQRGGRRPRSVQGCPLVVNIKYVVKTIVLFGVLLISFKMFNNYEV